MDAQAARARREECERRKVELKADGLPENVFRTADGRAWEEPLNCYRGPEQYSKTLRNAKAGAWKS